MMGMIISLSSTMVVIKSLMNSGLMNTLSARVMIGILIVQDLIAVPMMIMIPQLNNLSGGGSQILYTLGKGVLAVALIIILGFYIIPRILRMVAVLESRELFLLTITALGLGVGLLTHMAGLSFALGAFITGMVLNGSDYSHKAMNDIIPLRDIFGLIFFTSIGMLFNPHFFLDNIGIILILVATVHAGKFLIFYFMSRAFGYFNIVPLAVGIGLSQIGEFSFILAKLDFSEKLLDERIFSILLSTSVLTMFLSPFLLLITTPSYKFLKKYIRKNVPFEIHLIEEVLKNHTIIAGGGRVADSIASIFKQLDFSFVIIENDFKRFERLKSENKNAVFGDATSEDLLNACKISSAKLLIVTVPAVSDSRQIITLAQKYNPELRIIARCNHFEELDDLYNLKIFEVVQPEFEASLEIIRQSLMNFEVPITAIQNYLDDIRRKKYFSSIKVETEMLMNLKNASRLLEIHWIPINSNSSIIDKSLKELDLRTKYKISVVGIHRGTKLIQNPDSGFRFRDGDIIAILGGLKGKTSFSKAFQLTHER